MAGDITVRRLVTEWGFDVDQKPLQKFESTLQNLKRGVRVVGAAAATGAASLFGLAKQTSDTAIEMQRGAEAVGMQREEYQLLTQAASRYGVEADDVNDVLGVLSERAREAVNGQQSFRDAFKAAGVQMEELRGAEPEEIFRVTAESMRQLESDTRRLQAAEALLGGELQRKFMPMFQAGAESVDEMTQRLESLGTVMGDEAVQDSRQFESAMFFGRQALQGLANTAGAAALPTINELIGTLLDWFAANRKVIETNLESFIESTGDFVVYAAESLTGLISGIQDLTEAAGGLENILDAVEIAMSVLIGTQIYNGIVGLVGVVSTLAGSFSLASIQAWALNAAVAAIPVAIGALIALVGVLIEDFYRWTQGQESALGDLIEMYPWIGDALQSIADTWELVSTKAVEFYNWTKSTLFETIPSMASRWTTAIWDWITTARNAITGAFEGIWNSVEELFESMISGIADRISGLVSSIAGYASEIPGISGEALQGLAQSIDSFGEFSQGATAGAQGATTAAQQQIFEQQQQANYRLAPTFNVRQRPGEDGRAFADRVSQNQKEELERERRQTADFFSGGVSY
jgi:hypothetical protein